MPLAHCNLRDDVGRRTEAINTQIGARARHPIRTVADQSSTQERRDMHVVVFGREFAAEGSVGKRVFGVPAIELLAPSVHEASEPPLPALRLTGMRQRRLTGPAVTPSPSGFPHLISADARM